MSATLQFHPRRKMPFHRLPFVGKQHDGTPSFGMFRFPAVITADYELVASWHR